MYFAKDYTGGIVRPGAKVIHNKAAKKFAAIIFIQSVNKKISLYMGIIYH